MSHFARVLTQPRLPWSPASLLVVSGAPDQGVGGGLLQENHNHALPTGLTLLGILDVTQCDPLVC